MTQLKIIKGGKQDHEIIACHECNGTTLIPVVVGALDVEKTADGIHLIGGVDQMICAQCLAEGNIETVVT